MSVINNNLLLTAAAGGATAGRSVRFNSADSAYLSRTPASAGNRKTWTFSLWVKRSKFDARQTIIDTRGGGGTDTEVMQLAFNSSNALDVVCTSYFPLVTTQVFRDPSAWYHIVWSLDTTQGTASNRMKLYVNGAEITTFGTDNRSTLSQNSDQGINIAQAHHFARQVSGSNYGDYYLALVHFIDGQALTPSSFGETSATTGQWIAKTYSGTYGTNGFFLDFLDNSTAAALGYDAAGSNDWTVNNISVSNVVVSYTSGLSFVGYSGGTTISNPAFGFDNDINTRFEGDSASGGGQTAIFTWVPPGGSISATSFKLRLQYFGVQSFATISVAVNGGSYYSTGGGTSVTTYDFSSLITGNQITQVKLRWQSNQGGIGSPGWYALYVNDVILADSTGSDSLRDHPTSAGTSTGLGGEVAGNYCTLNPLARFGGTNDAKTYANGNLEMTATSFNSLPTAVGTIAATSGKWYAEVTAGHATNGIGFVNAANLQSIFETSWSLGTPADGWVRWDNRLFNNSSVTQTGLTSIATNDIVQIALDLDNGKVWFGINNTWDSGSPAAGTSPTATFTASGKAWVIGTGWRNDNVSVTTKINFGQRAFAYTAPSGFSPLVDTLLPTPTIAKPNTVMDVKLYTGNGSTQTISGLGFSPDFLWFKARSIAYSNVLYDTVRGYTKSLVSNGTFAEGTEAGGLSAFNSDGFSLNGENTFYGSTNTNGQTYVAWAFDAGSSNATNTSGTITSTVRANISAGFSIVTWTGGGSGYSVGHGLGVVPKLYIIKDRSNAYDWPVFTTVIDGSLDYLYLNLTDAKADSGGTLPTSTLVYPGQSTSSNYVMYCFAPVAGYSAFGSYTGTGSATDSPFIWTGFRPRWVLIKMSSSTGAWYLIDTARLGYNPDNNPLYPNLSVDEQTDDIADILSNGFKIRNSFAGVNTSSGTYVWAAFAENPFAYARAR